MSAWRPTFNYIDVGVQTDLYDSLTELYAFVADVPHHLHTDNSEYTLLQCFPAGQVGPSNVKG